jgi:hypothetical protein
LLLLKAAALESHYSRVLPDARCQVPGARCQMSDIRYQISDISYPGIRYRVPGTAFRDRSRLTCSQRVADPLAGF